MARSLLEVQCVRWQPEPIMTQSIYNQTKSIYNQTKPPALSDVSRDETNTRFDSQVFFSPFSVSRFSFRNLRRGTREPSIAEAYACWREVWFEALVELDGIKRLYSDDFTRQDEISALFYDDICVGLTGCRFVDISSEAARDDSYFKAWPEAALDALAADGTRLCIGNNMTVRREWRGRIDGLSIKRLLMILSIQRFLASDAHALAGTMRISRAMDRVVYDLGFQPIVRGVVHHGVEVDLVGYFRARQPSMPAPKAAFSREHQLASELFKTWEPLPERSL
jgi:hypothetical protein